MAQAILLEDVEKLGRRGDPVDVAPGYLRNYLIPRKLAAAGDAGRARGGAAPPRRRREGRESAGRARRAGGLAALQDRADDLPAGGRGRQALRLGRAPRRSSRRSATPATCAIDRRKVRLEQPIREIGTHMVEIELADGAVASVKTIVTEEK